MVENEMIVVNQSDVDIKIPPERRKNGEKDIPKY